MNFVFEEQHSFLVLCVWAAVNVSSVLGSSSLLCASEQQQAFFPVLQVYFPWSPQEKWLSHPICVWAWSHFFTLRLAVVTAVVPALVCKEYSCLVSGLSFESKVEVSVSHQGVCKKFLCLFVSQSGITKVGIVLTLNEMIPSRSAGWHLFTMKWSYPKSAIWQPRAFHLHVLRRHILLSMPTSHRKFLMNNVACFLHRRS